MLHMPTPMLIGRPSGPTYPQFQAHIAGLAINGAKPGSWQFTGNEPAENLTRKYVINSLENSGDMRGSSWGTYFAAHMNRAVQHAMPSSAVWLAQIADGREVYAHVDAEGEYPAFTGYTRNGYTSGAASADFFAAAYFDTLIFWNDGPWISRPYQGVGPSPYSWSV